MNSVLRRLLRANLLALVAVAVLLVFLPSVIDDSVLLRVFTTANIFVMFATSWDVLSGYTGQVNFGHAAFIGAGGFTVGLLTTGRLGGTTVSPEVALLMGTVVAALLGVAIGVPCLRLRGPYLALATLSAASALVQLSLIYKTYTGGEEGISSIPGLDESALLGAIGAGLGGVLVPGYADLRPIAQFAVINYYVVLLAMVVMVGGLLALAYGPRGLVLRSIQQDESAAEAAGVPVVRYKLAAFVLSGAAAGFAGSLFVLTRRNAGIDLLLIDLSLLVIIIAAIGGVGSIVGPAVGAYVVIFLQDYALDRYLLDNISALEGKEGEAKTLLFSLVLIIVLLRQPRGLVPPLLSRLDGRRAPGALAPPQASDA